MVAVVSGRTQLKRAGARYTGLCPFHEERTPSFSVNAVDKLYYCFGCGKGGDLVSFVQDDREPRLRRLDRVAGRSLRHRARAGAGLPCRGRADGAAPAAPRRAPARGALLRAAPLGRRVRPRGARVPRRAEPRGGDLPRVPAGVRARRPDPGAQGERGRVLGSRSSRLPGSSTGAATTTSPAGCCSRSADPRGRVLGFGARRLDEQDPLRAKYVNSPEGELFKKGQVVYGLDRARSAIAKQDRACRRRGLHGRAGAAAGRLRARRRLNGHRADGGAGEGARSADPAAVPVLRRGRGR